MSMPPPPRAPSPQRRTNKNAMAELKLRRVLAQTDRLRDELTRPRVRVSEASLTLIQFCQATRDPLLPSIWGELKKGEDPYAPPDTACCSIM